MVTSKIYILDDDLYFGRCIQRSLEKQYEEVRYFKTERNLMQAMENNPEILILDHNLGDDFGWDVAVKIKERGWKTHILYVSSQENVHVVLKAFQLGITAYFEKNGFTSERLLHAIHRLHLMTSNFNKPLNVESFRNSLLQSNR